MASLPVAQVPQTTILQGVFRYGAQHMGADGKSHPEDQTFKINYGTAKDPKRRLDFEAQFVDGPYIIASPADLVGWFNEVWPVIEGALLSLQQFEKVIPITDKLSRHGVVLIHCTTYHDVVVPELAADAVSSVMTAFTPQVSDTPTEEPAPKAKHNRQGAKDKPAFINQARVPFSH